MVPFVPKLGLCPHGVVSYKQKMSWELRTSHRLLGMWPTTFVIANVAMGTEARSQQKKSETFAHKEMSQSHGSLSQAWDRHASVGDEKDLPHKRSVLSLSQWMRQKERRRGTGKRKKTQHLCVNNAGWQCLCLQDLLIASHYKTVQRYPTTTGLRRGNLLKSQQGNTLRHGLFSCHILAAIEVYSQELTKVKHMGLFGWFSSSALEGTAHLSFRGSCRSSSSLSNGWQRCLKFKHCGNLHGNLHCNLLSPCHPKEALPRVEGKQLKCL